MWVSLAAFSVEGAVDAGNDVATTGVAGFAKGEAGGALRGAVVGTLSFCAVRVSVGTVALAGEVVGAATGELPAATFGCGVVGGTVLGMLFAAGGMAVEVNEVGLGVAALVPDGAAPGTLFDATGEAGFVGAETGGVVPGAVALTGFASAVFAAGGMVTDSGLRGVAVFGLVADRSTLLLGTVGLVAVEAGALVTGIGASRLPDNRKYPPMPRTTTNETTIPNFTSGRMRVLPFQ